MKVPLLSPGSTVTMPTRVAEAQRYHREQMWDIVLGGVALVGLVIAVLWLIGLPGGDDEEELAGFVTANWDEVKSKIDNG